MRKFITVLIILLACVTTCFAAEVDTTEGETLKEEAAIKVSVVERDAFMIAGLKYFGNNANDEIGGLWGEFSILRDSIKNQANLKEAFGYDTWDEKIQETGEFTYIAAVEVTDESGVPDGMEIVRIPANRYAVFTFELKLMGDNIVQEIYSKWLPESGYQMCDDYDFEYYDEAFHDHPDALVHFYIPIK